MKILSTALLLSCLAASPAFALVDQSSGHSPAGPFTISVSVDRVNPFAQSFTPTLTGIDYATFDIRNDFTVETYTPGSTTPVQSPNGPVRFSVSLYSGSGSYTAANLLGTSGPTVIPAATHDSSIPFLFANQVALAPGQTYSLVVNDLTAVPGTVYDDAAVFTGANYPGGHLSFSTTDSAYFSEGTGSPPSAVPEAPTWAMLIVGFGAIGSATRRRQRKTVRFT